MGVHAHPKGSKRKHVELLCRNHLYYGKFSGQRRSDLMIRPHPKYHLLGRSSNLGISLDRRPRLFPSCMTWPYMYCRKSRTYLGSYTGPEKEVLEVVAAPEGLLICCRAIFIFLASACLTFFATPVRVQCTGQALTERDLLT